MSKRPGEMPDAHVSAKSKPKRGLAQMKRSDGSEATKKDDRKEGSLGETATLCDQTHCKE